MNIKTEKNNGITLVNQRILEGKIGTVSSTHLLIQDFQYTRKHFTEPWIVTLFYCPQFILSEVAGLPLSMADNIDNGEKSLMKPSHDTILKGDGCLGSFHHLMINKISLAFSSERKT